MEQIIDIVHQNYILAFIIMLAISGTLLFSAIRTRKDILFFLCIGFSLLSAIITCNITSTGLNIEKELIVLFSLVAHVGILLSAFHIRKKMRN